MKCRIETALSKFLKTLLILGTVISFVSLVLIGIPLYLNWLVRLVVVITALVPAMCFIVGQYFFENRVAEPTFLRKYALRSLYTLIMLLLPPLLLTFKAELDPSHLSSGFALALLVALAMSLVFAEGDGWSRLFTHKAFVMYYAWRKESWEMPQSVIDHKAILASRSKFYVSRDSIREFQQTITCPAVDGPAVAAAINNSLPREPLSIVDVGGGDGLFTHSLIAALRDIGHPCDVKKLTMVDPVAWEADYRRELEVMVRASAINVVKKGFQVQEAPAKQDLIICSHSLYGIFDVNKQKMEDIIEALMRHLTTGGVLVILLASGHSASYQFKEATLQYLYGIALDDLSAERVEGVLMTRSELISKFSVDNLIDCSRVTKVAGGRSATDVGKTWLSYFLRSDINLLSVDDYDYVLSLLDQFADEFRNLPEAIKREFEGNPFTDYSKVLTHKSVVYVLRRSQ